MVVIIPGKACIVHNGCAVYQHARRHKTVLQIQAMFWRNQQICCGHAICNGVGAHAHGVACNIIRRSRVGAGVGLACPCNAARNGLAICCKCKNFLPCNKVFYRYITCGGADHAAGQKANQHARCAGAVLCRGAKVKVAPAGGLIKRLGGGGVISIHNNGNAGVGGNGCVRAIICGVCNVASAGNFDSGPCVAKTINIGEC